MSRIKNNIYKPTLAGYIETGLEEVISYPNKYYIDKRDGKEYFVQADGVYDIVPKAAGDIIRAAQYNSMMSYLRTARDKYYAGYAVGNDVAVGTVALAQQFNDASYWCNAVSDRSPLVYDYPTVAQGSIMVESPLVTMTNQIYQVSICYSNCHSNCYSDCYSDCDCQSCDPNGGN